MFAAVALGVKPSYDDWISLDKYDKFVSICQKYGMHVEPDVVFAPPPKDKSMVIGGKNITTTFFAGERFGRYRGPGDVHVIVAKSKDNALEAKRFGWYSVIVDNRSINKPFVDHLRFGLKLGFPECCVDFFRKYNNWSRYSHPYESYNNTPILPGRARGSYYCNNFLMDHIYFFIHNIPCSYRCAKTIEYAKRVEKEFMKVDPEFAKKTIEILKKPLLVFGERNFIIFDGELDGQKITFDNSEYLSNPARKEDEFARYDALKKGDAIELGEQLRVYKNNQEILSIERKKEWFLIDFD